MAPTLSALAAAWPVHARGWAILPGLWSAAYVLIQLLLVVYTSHRWVVLWRCWRLRHRARRQRPALAPDAWPVVTVQLPIYNERRVAERLIDAMAALDYPAGRLEIQVLDDSTDETRMRAAAAVRRHRERGVDIVHVCRPHRQGFKAGALAHGLARARGELIAVFDADFVPGPDFLRLAVPWFTERNVGMVQARWGHLNRRRSVLTAAQAASLDAHFLLEHASRTDSGLFFNFNGSAGVWRRACIEDAGGWSDDTVTEDLDLSYRAQLRGWRFVFDPAIESLAELPSDMGALKSQQRRWTRGAIQTARKLLPRVMKAPLPLRVRIEAMFHLTANAAYPLLFALTLLLPFVLLVRSPGPAWVVWGLQLGVIVFGVLPVTCFLAWGRRRAGARWVEVIAEVPAALVVGVGLSLHNTRAVLAGFTHDRGEWERTPKTGERDDARPAAYASVRGPSGRAELALALYAVGLGLLAWQVGQLRAMPFVALLFTGFACVGVGSWRAARASAGRGSP